MNVRLVTPRLILRDHCVEDHSAMLEIYRDPEFYRYERDEPYNSESVYSWLQSVEQEGEQEQRTRYHLAITIPPNGAPVGSVALTRLNADLREWEIGWGVRRDLWGCGYASEAAAALRDFARDTLHAHRLVAFCHAENAASARVMHKIGLTYEGTLKQTRRLSGSWWDELVYAAILQD